MVKQHIIPMFIPHAGCPHRCVFCDQVRISGETTPVTPGQVYEQLSAALPNAGENCELAFYGGSFTALPLKNQRGLLGAARPFLEDHRLCSIRVSTRPDAIDDSICEMLKEYGVRTVELGCQSMVDAVLIRSGRGHLTKDIEAAFFCLRKHGFSVILQMMTGLPGDSGRESLETADAIVKLHPDGVRIYPTVVLRGTELEKMMLQGTYTPQTVEQAVDLCAEIYQRFLTADIPVIRLGLNPSDELSGGEAVAGAYHPALGELVLSRMYLNRAKMLLSASPGSDAAVLQVHPQRISVMVGQKRENIHALCGEFGLKSVKVISGEQDLWEIILRNP